jgi:molecular chaperone IbpA
MTQLVRFDTNALNRALIGFDTMFNDFESRFANQINNNYPPYNVVKYDEDNYEIQVAVAGFGTDEVTVEVDQNQLIIKGEHIDVQEESTVYLHRGLAARNFVRSWTLADHMEVKGAETKNGMLSIKLQRIIPEALKPRKIDIISK